MFARHAGKACASWKEYRDIYSGMTAAARAVMIIHTRERRSTLFLYCLSLIIIHSYNRILFTYNNKTYFFILFVVVPLAIIVGRVYTPIVK